MPLTDAARLRQLLGEPIPLGGTDADTLFTDEEVDDFLLRSPDLNSAAAAGWEVKAANFANLITVTEGNASREMSDLHRHALRMVDFFESRGGVRNRVRIGKIVRPIGG